MCHSQSSRGIARLAMGYFRPDCNTIWIRLACHERIWWMEARPKPDSYNNHFHELMLGCESWKSYPRNVDTMVDILNNVPADGAPSLITHETFSCRVWVKDALHALNKNSIVRLSQPIQQIEEELLDDAGMNRSAVERKMYQALVLNDARFFTV